MQKKIIFALLISIIIASSIIDVQAKNQAKKGKKKKLSSNFVMNLYQIETLSYKMLTSFKQFNDLINFQQGKQFVVALLNDQSRAHHAVDIVFDFYDVDGDRKVSLANLKTRLQQVYQNTHVQRSGQYQKLEGEMLNAASQAFGQINQAVNNQQNRDSISYDTFYKLTEYYRQQAVNGGLEFFQTEKFHPYSFLQLLQKSKVVQFLTATQIKPWGDGQIRNALLIIVNSQSLFASTLNHIFHVADVDHSNSLTLSDFQTISLQVTGRQLPSVGVSDINEFIKNLDKNRDQQVQLSEFQAAYPYFRQFFASNLQ